MQSESIGKLALSLSKAQGKIRAAEEDSTNPFLKNKYASLNSVWDAIRAALSENELAVTQLPTVDGGNVILTTILMHSSGEFITSEIHAPVMDEKGRSILQGIGSALTYLRRYALAAMVGVTSDEDVDGNPPKPAPPATRAAVVESHKAAQNAPQNAPQVPQNANSTPPTTSGSNAPSATPPRPWDAQTLRSRIIKNAERLGKLDNGEEAEPAKRKACVIALAALTNHNDTDRHAITAYLFGKPSTKDLTKGEIESLIKWIGCDSENNPHPQAVAEARNVLAEYAAQQRDNALPAQPDEDIVTIAGV